MARHAQNVTPAQNAAPTNKLADGAAQSGMARTGMAHEGMARHAPTFVGGWHSPVEQEIERILARGGVPLAWVLARSPEKFRVPQVWRERLAAGRGFIVTPFATGHRLTAHSALQRNRWILGNCPRVIVPHAAPGGALHALLRETLATPHAPQIWMFEHADHATLFERGAQPL